MLMPPRAGGRPKPTRGTCRICTVPSPRWTTCTSCRDVAIALGRPLLPVEALVTVTSGHPLYRALRQYKSGEHGVARRQAATLASYVAGLASPRLDLAAPDGLDATVVVPSGGGRPPPHPLAEVARASGVLPAVLDALATGAHGAAHRRPALDAYRATADVANLRVLLLDDLYTTGAHLQSAAAVLADAGAARVIPLVLARYRRAPRFGAQAGPAAAAGRARHSGELEKMVSAPRGMGMGKGGRHLTDR